MEKDFFISSFYKRNSHRRKIKTLKLVLLTCFIIMTFFYTAPEAWSACSLPASVTTVTSAADSGPGSLRAAVEWANTTPGVDGIVFAASVTHVFITSGALTLTEGVVISGGTSGVYVDGISASGIFNAFEIYSSDSCFENLTISNFKGSAIVILDASNNSFFNITSSWNYFNGLEILGTGSSGNYIEGSSFESNGENGIKIAGGAYSNTITSTTVSSNANEGIYIFLSSHDNLIYGCTISDNRENGVFISESSYNNRVASSTIDGNFTGVFINYGAYNNMIGPSNIIDNSLYVGVTISDVGTYGNVVTDNVEIVGNHFYGVYLLNDATDSVVYNSGLISSSGSHGIFINNSGGNIIAINTISNNGEYGIQITGDSSDNILIKQNTINNNVDGGVHILEADGVTISGPSCSVNNNGGSGVVANASTNGGLQNFTISDCTITYNSGVGIDINNASTVNISNTTVQNNVSSGVEIKNSSTITISSTSMSWNGSTGFYLFNSSTVSFDGGDVSNNLYYGVRIAGSSSGVTLSNLTSISNNTHANVACESSSNITLSNIGDISNAGKPSAEETSNCYNSGSGVCADACDTIQVSGSGGINSNYYGIRSINGTSNVTLQNNLISNTTDTGIYLEGGNTFLLQGNSVSGGAYNLQVILSSGVTINSNNSFASAVTGIYISGSSPTIDGNSFSDCTQECIYISPYYGTDRSPSGTADDIFSSPVITNNTFAGSPAQGAIFSVDTTPSNFDSIIAGTSGNVFNVTTLAVMQAWYGIVYVINRDGNPVGNARITLEYTNGDDVSFTTNSQGIGAPGRSNPRADDVLTWGYITQLVLYPDGTTQNFQSAHLVAVKDTLSQQGWYSWDGNTNNDEPMRYALPSTTPGFEGVNQNGHYQAAVLVMETHCSAKLPYAGGGISPYIKPGAQLVVEIVDPDENLDDSVLDVITATVRVYDRTKTDVLDRTVVQVRETAGDSGKFRSPILNVKEACPDDDNGVCEMGVSGDPDCCVEATGEGTQYVRATFISQTDTYPPIDSCSGEVRVITNSEIYFYETQDDSIRIVTTFPAPTSIDFFVYDLDKRDGSANTYKRVNYIVKDPSGKTKSICYSIPIKETFADYHPEDPEYADGYFLGYVQAVTSQELADELNQTGCANAIYVEPGYRFCVSTQEVGENPRVSCAEIMGNSPCQMDIVNAADTKVSSYPVNSTMYFILQDRDENRNSQLPDEVQITVRNDESGDVELLTLVEDGDNTGVFRGEIFVSKYRNSSDVKSNDGVISANPDEVISVVFTDPDAPDDVCQAEANVVDTGTPSVLKIVDAGGSKLEIVNDTTDLYLELSDPDRNVATASPDEVTAVVFVGWQAPGEYADREVIKLEETGDNTGIFMSDRVEVEFSAGVPDDGVIQSPSNGLTVAAVYQDPVDITDRSVDTAVALQSFLKLKLEVLKKIVGTSSMAPFRLVIENPNPLPVAPSTLLIDVPPQLAIYRGRLFSKNGQMEISRGSPYTLSLTSLASMERRTFVGYFVPVPGVTKGTFNLKAVVAVNSTNISNQAMNTLAVTPDPIADNARIIGSVFMDIDYDGVRDPDEPGIAGVRVCIDKGACSITDEYGRYHINNIEVGESGTSGMIYERVQVKPDMSYLPPGFQLSEPSVIVELQRGETRKVNFPVFMELEPVKIPFQTLMKYRGSFSGRMTHHVIEGNAAKGVIYINGKRIKLPYVDADLSVRKEERYFILRKGRLDVKLSFMTSHNFQEPPDSYRFVIKDSSGKDIYTLEGSGNPPKSFSWNGRDRSGHMLLRTGNEYSFYIEAEKDGMYARSSVKTFVVLASPPMKTLERGVYFEKGLYYLLPEFIKKLRELAVYLRENPELKIIVEGHTDSSGPEWYNLELSKKRAEMVKDYLVIVEGISSDRITTIGYGESRPLYPNDTPENMARNRRVEIKTEGGKVLLQLSSFKPEVKVNGKKVDVDPSARFRYTLPPMEDKLSIFITDSTGKEQRFKGSFGHLIVGAPTSFEFALEEGKVVDLSISGEGLQYVLLDGERYDVPANEGLELSLFIKQPQGRFNITGFFKEHLPVRYVLEYTSTPVVKEGYVRSYLVLNLPEGDIHLSSRNLFISGEAPISCTVTVNGQLVSLDSEGRFHSFIHFPENVTATLLHVQAFLPEENVEIKKNVYFDKKDIYINALGYGIFGYSTENKFIKKGKLSVYGYGEHPEGLTFEFGIDSGVSDFEKMWKKIIQITPQRTDRIFQAIELNREYPEYGDDARSWDATASAGDTFLRLQFRKNASLVLGGYDTLFTDTELTYYNRSLYGLRYEFSSAELLKNLPTLRLKGFVSRENTAFERDEFRSTGGSLYFLRRKNVVEGSEKVLVELREHVSGVVVDYLVLKRNRDYSIDYSSGMIDLYYPLTTFVSSQRPDLFQEGHEIYLVVEYEYLSDGLENILYGERVELEPHKNVKLGVTAVKDGSYALGGIDVRFDFNRYVRGIFEFARSRRPQPFLDVSDDAGVSFYTQSITDAGSDWKDAWRVELGSDNDWFSASGFYMRREKGFTSGRSQSGGLEQYGLRISRRPQPLGGAFYYDYVDSGEGADRNVVQRVDLSGNYRWRSLQAGLVFSWAQRFPGKDEYGREAYISPSILYRFHVGEKQSVNPFIRAQFLLASRGHVYQGGHQVALGVVTDVLEPVMVSAEGSYGESGAAARVGLGYRGTKGDTTYASYSIMNRTGTTIGQFAFGTAYYLTKRMKFYGEQRIAHGGTNQRSNVVGVEWATAKGLNVNVYYEKGEIRVTSGSLERDTGGIVTTFQTPKFRIYGRFELSRSSSMTTSQGMNAEIAGRFKITKNLYTFSRYRRSLYKADTPTEPSRVISSYSEVTAGGALRDLFGRLDMLMKFSRVSDLREDVTGAGVPVKTQFLTAFADTACDVNDWLGFSFKTGWRRDRDKVDTISDAQDRFLVGPAVHLRFFSKWEAEVDYLLDYRSHGVFHGALVEVSRNIIEHLNLAAGYNFSSVEIGDYDLDSYTGHGFFVRVEGYY